jgi:hypothetical protein
MIKRICASLKTGVGRGLATVAGAMTMCAALFGFMWAGACVIEHAGEYADFAMGVTISVTCLAGCFAPMLSYSIETRIDACQS